MKHLALLVPLVCALLGAAAWAEEERTEETVTVSRPKTDEVIYRVAGDKFQVVFTRRGLAKAAKPGEKTLLVLTSAEPGSFSTVEIRKGAFIDSFAVLPQRRAKDDLSQNIPAQPSYASHVFIELDWRAFDTNVKETSGAVFDVEMAVLAVELRRAGLKEDSIPSKYSQMKKALTNLLPKVEKIRKDLSDQGYRVEGQRKSKEEWDELYLDCIQKQALLRALQVKYPLQLQKVKLTSMEKLATVALQLPGVAACLSNPGPGADDRGERALTWFTTQTIRLFEYALGKPGAANRLSPEERQAADKALAFSIRTVFTPDESGQKARVSALSQPFRAGLLGVALKEIELNGRTDPKAGSPAHWWSVETAHPRDFAVNVSEDQLKAHVVQWFPRGTGSSEMLIRVRGIGDSAANYSLKCSDTILSKGDAVRVFANDQPLRGGFPY